MQSDSGADCCEETLNGSGERAQGVSPLDQAAIVVKFVVRLARLYVFAFAVHAHLLIVRPSIKHIPTPRVQ